MAVWRGSTVADNIYLRNMIHHCTASFCAQKLIDLIFSKFEKIRSINFISSTFLVNFHDKTNRTRGHEPGSIANFVQFELKARCFQFRVSALIQQTFCIRSIPSFVASLL